MRGGHAQTLAAYYWPGKVEYRAARHRVTLADGDAIVLHDDCPPGWAAGDRAVLLMPGLAGCHQSGYLVRTAAKLNSRGLRTFRMDHRGWGAGAGLARHPFHAGRSEDVLAAILFIAESLPRIAVGRGGVFAQRECDPQVLGRTFRSAAGGIGSGGRAHAAGGFGRLWRIGWNARPTGSTTAFMMSCLLRHLRENDRPPPSRNGISPAPPKTLREFDDWYTAPASGFEFGGRLLRSLSSAPLLSRIEIPTLIVAAADDPMIPIASFDDLADERTRALHVSPSGGHLGFIGRGGGDPDRRWLDWRIVDWFTAEEFLARSKRKPDGA